MLLGKSTCECQCHFAVRFRRKCKGDSAHLPDPCQIHASLSSDNADWHFDCVNHLINENSPCKFFNAVTACASENDAIYTARPHERENLGWSECFENWFAVQTHPT